MKKDIFLNSLSDDWNEIKEIVVFGFGRTAIRNVDKLAQDFKISMIIDNDPSIHGKKYRNCEVVSFHEAKDKIENRKIVVATSSVAYVEISEQLKSIGKQENIDFCRLKDFMAEWYWNNRGQVCLSQTFSSITSKCTFNCKYCNFFMPYFKCDANHFEYGENEILEDFDVYFRVVDYVASWSIIGGEPLLNNNLSQIIEEVYHKYHDKIGYIQVISNGSIVPDTNLITTMQKCNVRMRLSDYTHMIPYKEKLQQVRKCLKENNIPYDMSVYTQWYDLGIRKDTIPEFDNEEKITKHMRLCATGCHQLNDKRFYFCGQGFARSKKGLCALKEGDFIELQKCTGSDEDKEMMLKYCMGYPPKGYISVCGTCYGMGKDNDRVVGVAEQM